MSLQHPARQGFIGKSKPTVGVYDYISTTSEANLLLVGTDTGLKDLSRNNWAFGNVTNVSTTTVQTKNNPIAINVGSGTSAAAAWLTLTGSISSTEFEYGTGDFTWESWVYFRDSTTFNYMLTSNRFGSTNGFGWQLNAARVDVYVGTGAGSAVERAISPAMSTSTWHHIALCRKAGTVSWYIDGNRVHQATITTSGTVPRTVSAFTDDDGPARTCNMYIDEMRHVKGAALYQGTQYVVPTGPLTTSSLTISVYSTTSNYGINQNI